MKEKVNTMYNEWSLNALYTGADDPALSADMKKLEADPISQEWEVLMRSMMIPVDDRKEGEFWAGMTEVYHLG